MGPYSLMQHFVFYDQSKPDVSEAPPHFFERLREEAQLVVRNAPDKVVEDPDVIFARWRRAFLRWEDHAAIGPSQAAAAIKPRRKKLITDISNYFKQGDRIRQVQIPGMTGFQANAVHMAIAAFFRDTQIHKYL